MSKTFEYLEHTADVAVRIYGKDLAELFAHAAQALFSVITNLESVRTQEERAIEAQGEDRAALLHNFLDELLFRFDSEGFIARDVTVHRLDEGFVQATARGEKLDRQRHEFLTDIKAVTYHELKVERMDDGWEAHVIFDL
ncbi:MAG: archease [Acidobacteria bacterium]|nr:archease [Acidobacteriota bacterium]